MIVRESDARSVAHLPRLIADAHPAAAFVWDEFFSGTIRNPHTRTAYLRAVRQFLEWAEQREPSLARITPGLVGRYFDDPPRRSICPHLVIAQTPVCRFSTDRPPV